MISLSLDSSIDSPVDIAIKFNIKLETSHLIFIGNHGDDYFEKVESNPITKYSRSAHGPFFDLIPGTIDLELRELIKKRFIKTIEWSNRLGINHMVFHSGWFQKTYSLGKWLESTILFWDEMKDKVNDATTIYIENVFEDKPEIINELIKGIGDERFKACLDVGHVNANSGIALDKWLKVLGNRIGHIHLHNNNGKDDEHNGLMIGTMKFPETFKMIKDHCEDAFWNLEVKNEVEKSIEIALENR